jgi:hypothetical protein
MGTSQSIVRQFLNRADLRTYTGYELSLLPKYSTLTAPEYPNQWLLLNSSNGAY